MEKWADYLISAKRKKDDKYISHLKVHIDKGDKVGTGEAWFRQDVISTYKAGNTFMTIIKDAQNKWQRGAFVHVVKVDGEEFLRTDKNNTAKDNLGNLPDF